MLRLMYRYLHISLLLCALFGLIGQSVAANAHLPCAGMTSAAPTQAANAMPMAAGHMDCCPEAKVTETDPTPAKKTMPNCPMVTGCFAPLAAIVANEAVMPVMAQHSTESAIWPLTVQLGSRATAPEPPPPTI